MQTLLSQQNISTVRWQLANSFCSSAYHTPLTVYPVWRCFCTRTVVSSSPTSFFNATLRRNGFTFLRNKITKRNVHHRANDQNDFVSNLAILHIQRHRKTRRRASGFSRSYNATIHRSTKRSHHWQLSRGDSRMKKVGGHCGAKEKVRGKHKCLSCMVIFIVLKIIMAKNINYYGKKYTAFQTFWDIYEFGNYHSSNIMWFWP